MTSLILGRYWSSEAGEGSSPNAVSRQFRKSSGTWASSLVSMPTSWKAWLAKLN